MRLEEVLAIDDVSEIDFISRQLGLGGLDPNLSPAGLQIAKDVIRYVVKRDGIRDVKTLMEAACDALGR